MKKTIIFLLPTLLLLIFTIALKAQPSEWSLTETSMNGGTLQGNIEISGLPASTGDWIAAFGPTGTVVGLAQIAYDGTNDIAFFQMIIYGNDGVATTLMNPGEFWTMKIWDMDEDDFYTLGDPEPLIGEYAHVAGTGPFTNLTMDGNDITNGFFTFTVNFDNLLPIELGHFDVQSRSCDSYNINWMTLSEINNDYFTIERSVDNISDFEAIATIEGAGNSDRELNYSYTDEVSIGGSHTLYYRLKQTDYDGRYSFSNIASVKYECNEIQPLNAYPNPASNHINLSSESDEKKSYSVYDESGKIITTGTIDQSIEHIDVTAWTNGCYLLVSQNEGGDSFTQKIFVQN